MFSAAWANLPFSSSISSWSCFIVASLSFNLSFKVFTVVWAFANSACTAFNCVAFAAIRSLCLSSSAWSPLLTSCSWELDDSAAMRPCSATCASRFSDAISAPLPSRSTFSAFISSLNFAIFSSEAFKSFKAFSNRDLKSILSALLFANSSKVSCNLPSSDFIASFAFWRSVDTSSSSEIAFSFASVALLSWSSKRCVLESAFSAVLKASASRLLILSWDPDLSLRAFLSPSISSSRLSTREANLSTFLLAARTDASFCEVIFSNWINLLLTSWSEANAAFFASSSFLQEPTASSSCFFNAWIWPWRSCCLFANSPRSLSRSLPLLLCSASSALRRSLCESSFFWAAVRSASAFINSTCLSFSACSPAALESACEAASSCDCFSSSTNLSFSFINFSINRCASLRSLSRWASRRLVSSNNACKFSTSPNFRRSSDAALPWLAL